MPQRKVVSRWSSAFLLAAAMSQPAMSGELHIYEHNGSVIDWYIFGDAIKATYSRPRPGLIPAGIREGSVLFEGYYEAGRIVGTAYVFRAGCDPAGYEVIGEDEGDRITLRGPAPRREKAGCTIKDYSLKSPHAELVLIYSSTHH